jgi:hypothetical protein
MRILLIILPLITNLFLAQDRLSFIKDEELRSEIEKSVDFLARTKMIPLDIKSKVIFITLDLDKVIEREILGLNYSTSIPLLSVSLDQKGQFVQNKNSNNNWFYYNYSPNIVLVLRVFTLEEVNEYFDLEKMRKLSNEVQIYRKNIISSEFFKYQKGDKYNTDAVENVISLDKKDGKFIPVRINSFDLKTFMEVWYGLEVNKIPVNKVR